MTKITGVPRSVKSVLPYITTGTAKYESKEMLNPHKSIKIQDQRYAEIYQSYYTRFPCYEKKKNTIRLQGNPTRIPNRVM
jgi:hypothetical protein